MNSSYARVKIAATGIDIRTPRIPATFPPRRTTKINNTGFRLIEYFISAGIRIKFSKLFAAKYKSAVASACAGEIKRPMKGIKFKTAAKIAKVIAYSIPIIAKPIKIKIPTKNELTDLPHSQRPTLFSITS